MWALPLITCPPPPCAISWEFLELPCILSFCTYPSLHSQCCYSPAPPHWSSSFQSRLLPSASLTATRATSYIELWSQYSSTSVFPHGFLAQQMTPSLTWLLSASSLCLISQSLLRCSLESVITCDLSPKAHTHSCFHALTSALPVSLGILPSSLTQLTPTRCAPSSAAPSLATVPDWTGCPSKCSLHHCIYHQSCLMASVCLLS